MHSLPTAPPPPESSQPLVAAPPTPRALKPVLGLLLANLALSVGLTVAVLIKHTSVINYQLAHHHLNDASLRSTERTSLEAGLWSRVGGNVIISIVYAFLVRALLRGRRWAYRRVILIGAVGLVGLLAVQTSPYPTWIRFEQLAQAAILAALLYFVLRPDVRAFYAKGLPGRDVRRFRTE